jgi:hypothetical protein
MCAQHQSQRLKNPILLQGIPRLLDLLHAAAGFQHSRGPGAMPRYAREKSARGLAQSKTLSRYLEAVCVCEMAGSAMAFCGRCPTLTLSRNSEIQARL